MRAEPDRTPAEGECSRCGACCCGRPGTVLVIDEDAVRWRQAGRQDLIAELVPGHFGCRGLPTTGSGECVHLRRSGAITTCGIYPLRPLTCATFQAGSAQCKEYRRRGGRE